MGRWRKGGVCSHTILSAKRKEKAYRSSLMSATFLWETSEGRRWGFKMTGSLKACKQDKRNYLFRLNPSMSLSCELCLALIFS